MSFCWIRVFLLYKGRGKEDGVGGWGLTGTPIDMSSSYLRNEFFFSLELRRHTDTTLHFGHLHGNKCKQIIRTEVVSRTVRAIALCILTVHHFIRYMHIHICEQKISCSFFSAGKNCHRQVNGFGNIPFIPLL